MQSGSTLRCREVSFYLYLSVTQQLMLQFHIPIRDTWLADRNLDDFVAVNDPDGRLPRDQTSWEK